MKILDALKKKDSPKKTELKREVCVECRGAGLKQPTFVGSKVCERCKGECVEPQ